tara:strand:- start:170 stop:811 length:642 start_codon:yes stop_codon:yes gene_type:complete
MARFQMNTNKSLYIYLDKSIYVMIQPFFSDFIKMDTDWIRHEQRLSIINQKCLPEKLPYITLEFIYINKNSEVVETTSEKLPIPANTSCLSKEFIISIIHNHKKKKSTQNYVLKETLMYHIPIQPEVLPAFLENTFNSSTFIKKYPIIEDIVLPSSIFIFHPVNTLFFVYFEQDNLATKLIKSAFKSNQSNSITKRVRIKLPIPRNTRRTSST